MHFHHPLLYCVVYYTVLCAVYVLCRTYRRDRCALKFSSITIIFFIHHYFICNVRFGNVCMGLPISFCFHSGIFHPTKTLPVCSFILLHSIHTFLGLCHSPSFGALTSCVLFVKFPSVFSCVPFVLLAYRFCCRLIRCFWAVYFVLHQIHFDNCYFRNGFDCSLVLTN